MIPDERPIDRLVLINPALFSLSPMLEPMRRRLEMTTIYGAQFLSDDPATKSEYRSKSGLAHVAQSHAVAAEFARLAEAEGVQTLEPKDLQLRRLDETGLDVTFNGKSELRATALIVGGMLSDAQHKMLGLPDGWGGDVMHRYTFLKLSGIRWADLGSRPIMPMSLNLMDTLCWGWLLPGPKGMQLAVEQRMDTAGRVPPTQLLNHWAQVLRNHGLLNDRELPLDAAESIDLPLAGALAHEGVANRTLLVGPAGGFFSACTEDIYPNCWSAIFAADAMRKALKERHLQDALQPYRSRWRTTLGEYLRGPQQNFRFLLPLIYRNEVMTTRLTECILLGKSVVR